MLKQRIITAAILIPLVLAFLFLASAPAFAIVTGLIALGGAWEWSNLMTIKSTLWRFMYVLLIAAGFAATLIIPVQIVLLIAFIWWLIGAVLVLFYPYGSPVWGKGFLLRGIMGIFVLVPCWAALNFIFTQPNGSYTILFLFILIWGADSAAYFVGRAWGKHKLARYVSPGKTVEGLYGALFFSAFIAVILLAISRAPTHAWFAGVVLALATVIFSIVGDLFESMLKRQANIKDSGNILPGHGGLLDRIDSLTAAAPIFAFEALLLSKYL